MSALKCRPARVDVFGMAATWSNRPPITLPKAVVRRLYDGAVYIAPDPSTHFTIFTRRDGSTIARRTVEL